QLVSWGALGEHLVHTDHRADAVSDFGPVSGDHNDPADTAVPQRADGPGGIWAERIVEDQNPGRLSIDGNEDAERAVEPGPPPRVLPPPGPPGPPSPAGLADGAPVPASRPPDALPGPPPPLMRRPQPTAALRGRRNHGAGQHVHRHLIQRRRQ